MVTACKMDLEMEEFGAQLSEAWNRHYLTSLAVDLTIQKETITAHKSKNKSNSRIKNKKSFLNLLNSNYN
jgi:hypothetical protein